jgi:hypothetical protein
MATDRRTDAEQRYVKTIAVLLLQKSCKNQNPKEQQQRRVTRRRRSNADGSFIVQILQLGVIFRHSGVIASTETSKIIE